MLSWHPTGRYLPYDMPCDLDITAAIKTGEIQIQAKKEEAKAEIIKT
jgi:hypothetical protein